MDNVWGTLGAAPTDPRGSRQHFARWIYKSSITSNPNHLIRPKLLYVFENITNLAGKDPVHVHGLASKELFPAAKIAGAQHSWPRRLVGKASGRFQRLREKGGTAFILLQQNPLGQNPLPSTLPQPHREISAPRREQESSKGSRTHSVPQPETQQSTGGFPDLFQTGLSPRAREHKSITPHGRSASCVPAGWAPSGGSLLPVGSIQPSLGAAAGLGRTG